MILLIDDFLELELITKEHAHPIFELANTDRDYLKQWLSWVDNMHSVKFIENFIDGSISRNQNNTEFAFVIKKDKRVIGRIGVYKIDQQNKIGEIGYWIGQQFQGQGIVQKATKRVMDFCWKELQLNRLEIKCASQNVKSQYIPSKLGFEQEGILKEAELLYGVFHDLVIFAMIKNKNR